MKNHFFSRHYSFFAALALLIFVALGCGEIRDDRVSQRQSGSDWRRELAGKKLTTVKSSGSFSDRIDIWFCSSGEYFFRKETTGFSTGGVGTGSYASQNTEHGTWSVDSSTLTFRPDKAEAGDVQVSRGSGGNIIKLNAVAYQVSSHNSSCSE